MLQDLIQKESDIDIKLEKAYIYARRYFNKNKVFKNQLEFFEVIVNYYSWYTGINIEVIEFNNEPMLIINSNINTTSRILDSMNTLIEVLSTLEKIMISS